MKPFAGFKSEASSNKPRMLPAGPYVAVIKAVKVDGEEPDQSLILRLDVSEGEFKDYFMNRYKRESESGKYEPKYKGDFRLRIPNPDNTKAMYPESDLRNFNDAMYRIESSNPGYKWDWEERGLIGKTVGINMQEKEYNGSTYTKIGRLEIAEDVRKGIVKTMPSKVSQPTTDTESGMTVVQQEELPWSDKPSGNPYF